MSFDLLIKNGLVFDGSGSAPVKADVAIKNGVVQKIGPSVEGSVAKKVIDAKGCWVTPGFVDLHTHYDAELIAAPSLTESVRHGVTTIAAGSCSISAILSEPEDCSDLFTRVESVPREQVLPLFREKKTWSSPREYVEFLNQHPLGANVTSFLGHSDLRTRVLGLERAVDGKTVPTEEELKEMEHWLEEGLDCGLLGLSTMTNPWDKLDGDRFRSKALPSTYASWSEYRRLHKVLRKHGKILQSAPNLETKINTLQFFLETASLFGLRKALKTTLITLADAKSSPPKLHRIIAGVTRFVNRFLGGDLRWQTLPVPFEVHADGIDLVVFEEFDAGRAVLHLVDEVERNTLMQDEAYRRSFRKDYEKKWTPRVWQRDLYDATITHCPDEPALVGKTFGAVADERNIHPVDAFLDLVVQYGKKVRWKTVIANHRPKEVAHMANEPVALMGFADSGAHIRNMAFYNFPLRMLKLVRDAELAGNPIMSIERAVYRLTGEIADWLDVDAGHLRVGDRADIAVIDPTKLDDRLAEYREAPMEALGLMRMVNVSDGAVRNVVINGKTAFEEGDFDAGFGHDRGFGSFLPAGKKVPGTSNTKHQQHARKPNNRTTDTDATRAA
jgi:N-acyl-D-aspartate/D-glutamate deacylase